MFARQVPFLDTEASKRGIRVKTVPDLRWKRRDIKTVMLLASAMAKQEAIEAGFDDAWMVEGGLVTEGSSNNAYIVKDGVVKTRHLSTDILPGCTRRALLALAAETDVRVEESPFFTGGGEGGGRGVHHISNQSGHACCRHRRSDARRQPPRPPYHTASSALYRAGPVHSDLT